MKVIYSIFCHELLRLSLFVIPINELHTNVDGDIQVSTIAKLKRSQDTQTKKREEDKQSQIMDNIIKIYNILGNKNNIYTTIRILENIL